MSDQMQFSDPSLPLAVVVAGTDWNEPPRMRHHITRQLMRWCNVLFVEFMKAGEGEGNSENWRREGPRLIINRPARAFSFPVQVYANIPLVHAFVNKRYAKGLFNTIRRLRSGPVLLFNFVYHFPEVMNGSDFDYRAYICVDELPAMWRGRDPGNYWKRSYQTYLFQSYENRVASLADQCFTPHTKLREKLRPYCPNISMMYHAYDGDLRSLSTDTAAHRSNGRGALVHVAFMGYIHYRLLDEWLERVLEESDMRLHMFGPVNTEYDMGKFEKLENFSHHPPVAESELVSVLKEMDVLIMPYNPDIPECKVLTTVSKLYQYVASGKPVVISALPHFVELPEGVIYRAHTGEEFVSQIRIAFEEDCEELRETRVKVVRNNTWDKRGEQLHACLKEVLGDGISDLET